MLKTRKSIETLLPAFCDSIPWIERAPSPPIITTPTRSKNPINIWIMAIINNLMQSLRVSRLDAKRT